MSSTSTKESSDKINTSEADISERICHGFRGLITSRRGLGVLGWNVSPCWGRAGERRPACSLRLGAVPDGVGVVLLVPSAGQQRGRAGSLTQPQSQDTVSWCPAYVGFRIFYHKKCNHLTLFLSNAAKLLCINLLFFAALLCLICTMCHVFPVSCICWAWHCITSQVDDAFGLGGLLC